MKLQEQLRNSVAKLMQAKGITRTTLGQIMHTDGSQVSRILNGEANFTLRHIELIANHFNLRAIDIFTYPDVYTKQGADESSSEVFIQLRLSKERKDQILRTILKDTDIELLSNSNKYKLL